MSGFDLNPSSINIEPSDTSGRQVVAKTFIGLVIGIMIAVMIFVIMTMIGHLFTDAMQNQNNQLAEINPLISLILILIAFVSTFIGNMIVAGLYSLFYSKKYYDTSKMFSLLILSNVILFFVLAPVYIVFNSDIEILFLLLAFHVIFSIFISHAMLEFVANPNYAGSALVGTLMGFVFFIFTYSIIHKFGNLDNEYRLYFLMLLPCVLGYTTIPFWNGIWDIIYYKFYEMGNNFFYIPSLSEVVQTEQEAMAESAENFQEEDVNVNL